MSSRDSEAAPLMTTLINDNRLLKESLRVVVQDINDLKHADDDHTDTERLLKEEMLTLKKEIELLKSRR